MRTCGRCRGFDSIRALQIVLDTEAWFDIEIDDHVVFGIRTISEFAEKVDHIVTAGIDPAGTL